MSVEKKNILDEIVSFKKKKIAKITSVDGFDDGFERTKALAKISPKVRDFKGVLKSGSVNIIAEVKHASPSKGLLSPDFDPVLIAKNYEENGASAISVLTEENFFKGNLGHLIKVRENVSVPVLMKDFIIDPYEIYSARISGADAVLLIVSILSKARLTELIELARELNIATIVEVHSKIDLGLALELGADIIGINNRDLNTFETDITTTIELVKDIPDGVLVVSESGISSAEDIKKLKEAGVSAFLVGEALMKDGQSGEKLKELLGAG
ncbi:MAG: indole-3-glycerol phosphate synthase TrpC [Deltaproteobacteria bacterium]|nr:indole-3-glycerol phosphate synthase TrpC [Deltaproteobacteria bacterium]